MAARRRQNRPPPRRARQVQTQTRRRDQLIARVEAEYIKVVRAQQNAAENLIEEWIARNAVDGSKRTADSLVLVDVGERELIASLRGLFRSGPNLRAFFGRMSSLIEGDVQSTLEETIPSISRRRVTSGSTLKQFTTRNAGLIRSLSGVQVQRLSKVIRTGEGRHVASLTKEFQNAFGATEARAKLWARDQTLKLHAEITQERHRALGIDRYFWTDSNDERVREIHGELGARSDQGETFAYKDPPVFSEDGRRGNPGEDFQCRCTAYPVL